MAYSDAPVNCDNYPCFVRTFNKPHHEIENDTHLWDKVASLIDAEVVDNDRPRKGGADIGTENGQEFAPSVVSTLPRHK